MVDLLVRQAAVVLEDVVILGASGLDKLLGDGLQGNVSIHRAAEKAAHGGLKGHSPGYRPGGRPGYRGASRHGTWG